MLRSHPNKELYQHLYNTWVLRKNKICKDIEFICIGKKDLDIILELVLKLHDLGKGMRYFQEYIEDIEAGLKVPRHKNSEEKNHGLISGVLSFAITLNLLQKTELAFLVFIAVYRHHGNLKDIQAYRADLSDAGNKELLMVQFKSLRKDELQDTINRLGYGSFDFSTYSIESFEKTIEVISSIKSFLGIKKMLIQDGNNEGFLLINYIFSVLIYADKLEAIINNSDITINEYLNLSDKRYMFESSIVEEYKIHKFSSSFGISSLRENVYNDVIQTLSKIDLDKNRILSINLPTGTGKTLTALKAALIIREKITNLKGYIPRIIYALPFTTIIDQNYTVFEEVFNECDNRFLIKHHYLSEKSYRYSENDTKAKDVETKYNEYEYDIAAHLIESWDSEVVVTTFFQVLHSILSNCNRSLKKFHTMVGSIIILDEVQNIRFEHWPLVKQVFQTMAVKMKCIFIFMTATMPLIFSEEKNEICELAKNKIQYFKELNRIKLDVSRLKEEKYTLESLIIFLSDEIETKNPSSVLIVLNTIKSSIYIYEKLGELFSSDYEFYYLSTNIIPFDRKKRIENIKNNDNYKIIVSTQMIEAGVDIDVDYVYRDFGPMDSINQTAGRCNRNGKSDIGMGQVTIFRLVDTKENSNNTRDFCNYVYDKKLLEATEKVLLKYQVIEENMLFNLSHDYYNELLKIGSIDKGLEFVDNLNQLKYTSFNMQKDSFRIIDSDYKTTDLFIQIDNQSINIWEKYHNISKIKNIFERKKAFASIKVEFLDYVISVPEYIAKKQLEIEDISFTLVSNQMVNRLYNIDTGFIRDNERDFFF